MRKNTLFIGSVLALALASPLALAQVYKWTDANGQVHFSDRGPSDATQVKGPTPPAQPAQAAQAAPAARPAAAPAPGTLGTAPPPVSSEQARQVQRDVAAARAEQCKEARENYDKSVRAQRIYKTNDKGEREYMSVQDADAARLQLKANVDSFCGS